ncbi:MAG: response regulator [Christensenellaceae bacterium]|nr:response regulator [Christensenellaceae bacterium]MEA5067277.1 response regulator [Eubacteriales bacterium]MEA5068185.1 response regulator [Christensenellaceae bacterium]
MYRLLVVDDEKLIAEGMRKAIDRLDLFETRVAHSGAQALSIIDAERVHAMLLDISMPDMDGMELMRVLGERADRPLTIVISGYDEFAYARQALTYGAVDYVLKPVDSDDVAAMGRRLFALLEARAQQAAESAHMKAMLSELLSERPAAGDEAAGPSADAPQRAAERARRAIAERFCERNLSVNALSATLGYSPNYLGNVFKRTYGMSINDCINQHRVAEAKRLMDETDMMVYEIAFKVGFSDQHYFSKTFKRHAGASPSEYRQGR